MQIPIFTNTHYYVEKPDKPFDEPVVLVGSDNAAATRPYLGDDYYRFDYRLIWWPLERYKDFAWENLKRKLPADEQPPLRQVAPLRCVSPAHRFTRRAAKVAG